MKVLRVFVAVPVGNALLQGILALQHRIATSLGGTNVRWTKPEQLHLTLRFLGNVTEHQVGDLSAALGRACSGQVAFDIVVEGLGCFPSPQQPRIVWVGITEGAVALSQLAERVRTETATFGDSTETKPLVPHLTIGRSKAVGAPSRRLGELIEKASPGRIGTVKVSEVLLMRSELAHEGSCYTIIGREVLADRATR